MKVNMPCFFMICTDGTEKECLEKGLLGDRKWRLQYFKTVKKGDLGFLLNISQNSRLGIFEAESPAKLDIDENAWGGGFPAQIKVRLIGELQRIKNASEKISKFIDLREIKRDPFSYKVPAKATYGPEISEKIIRDKGVRPQHSTR